jgi:hypothetical protein
MLHAERDARDNTQQVKEKAKHYLLLAVGDLDREMRDAAWEAFEWLRRAENHLDCLRACNGDHEEEDATIEQAHERIAQAIEAVNKAKGIFRERVMTP